MTLMRRQFLYLAAAAAAAPAVSPVARSQTYPARPMRVIVPVAAGGPTDVIARLIAQRLSDRWGEPVYVENIPAGAGNVGTSTAAKALPDGYTVVMVTTGFVINPSLYTKLPYDPIKDFAPVTVVAASPHVLVVHPSLPASNVQELVALVKANPGKYSYASPGTGQSGQLAGELFRLALGLDLVHVPFNGGAPAITSTIGGHTPIAFMALSTAAAAIKEGKLRALAVTSRARSELFPDVPTMAEAGVPDQESIFVQAILFPAGTPQDIVTRWHQEVVRIVALPDVKQRLAAMNLEPVANTPEEFAAWIKAEIPRWRKVIDDTKIKKIDDR
jgi:tripartite-type tricarboxylate transporter receptor subunit TctC